jgi:hypothetical protein
MGEHGTPENWIGMGVIHDTTRSLVHEFTDPLFDVIHREATVEKIPSTSPDEAAVVLVLLIPGKMMPPHTFTGIRTSSYFKEHHAKQLQVAVPDGLETPEKVKEFFAWAFTEAPAIALKALRRQRVVAEVNCATEAARRIVAHLDEAIAEADKTWSVRRKLWE